MEFKLQVPDLAFNPDKLSTRTLGYYRGYYNGFGLRREIAINIQYVSPENFWDVLGTLAHELIHAHQDMTGTASKKRNHHKPEFSQIAKSMDWWFRRRAFKTIFPTVDSSSS